MIMLRKDELQRSRFLFVEIIKKREQTTNGRRIRTDINDDDDDRK